MTVNAIGQVKLTGPTALYKDPDPASKRIATLYENTVVFVKEKQEDFYLVVFQNKSGYIHKSYLSLETEESNNQINEIESNNDKVFSKMRARADIPDDTALVNFYYLLPAAYCNLYLDSVLVALPSPKSFASIEARPGVHFIWLKGRLGNAYSGHMLCEFEGGKEYFILIRPTTFSDTKLVDIWPTDVPVEAIVCDKHPYPGNFNFFSISIDDAFQVQSLVAKKEPLSTKQVERHSANALDNLIDYCGTFLSTYTLGLGIENENKAWELIDLEELIQAEEHLSKANQYYAKSIRFFNRKAIYEKKALLGQSTREVAALLSDGGLVSHGYAVADRKARNAGQEHANYLEYVFQDSTSHPFALPSPDKRDNYFNSLMKYSKASHQRVIAAIDIIKKGNDIIKKLEELQSNFKAFSFSREYDH